MKYWFFWLFYTSTFAHSAKPELHMIAYSHLDTEWNWTIEKTIQEFLPDTLNENFKLFEKYPHYEFNFTGSERYEMVKEYYPELYQKLKKYVLAGRWHPSGSSVDEVHAIGVSGESMFRQILYANQFFEKEFGEENVSHDLFLPDTFGFQSSLPTIMKHAGLVGFSTQKLRWNSANGIPFDIGMWQGVDGNEILSSLNPGIYNRQPIHPWLEKWGKWVKRIFRNGEEFGVFKDYRYYGVGDKGGAPLKKHVHLVESFHNREGKIEVVSKSSDLFFKEMTEDEKKSLPRYAGDLLLVEHSAGSLTSQVEIKKLNRENEVLLDIAERFSVLAEIYGVAKYPKEFIHRNWRLLLRAQDHNTLTGTSVPKAIKIAINDLLLVKNQMTWLIQHLARSFLEQFNTNTGKAENLIPLVIFNPLEFEREDIIQVQLPDDTAEYVLESQSKIQFPVQKNGISFVKVSAGSIELFWLRKVSQPNKNILKISQNSLESDQYKITLNEQGDINQIIDLKFNKALLSSPHEIVFLSEKPKSFPAWNMYWKDRKKIPVASFSGKTKFTIVEDGAARVTLAVEREKLGSKLIQEISLSPGSRQIRIKTKLDWKTKGHSLKASFPLSVSAAKATYNWTVGTIQRENNHPKQFEVPSHHWADLSSIEDNYGVSILEDGRYGWDKPNDNTLRLTMVYTPKITFSSYFSNFPNESNFSFQGTQDFGYHEFTYAIVGHSGDHTNGTEQEGLKLNYPLFSVQETSYHLGNFNKNLSGFSSKHHGVAIRALKKAEVGNDYIVRLQELHGKINRMNPLRLNFNPFNLKNCNAQEKNCVPLENFDFKTFEPKTIKFSSKIGATFPHKPLPLNFNTKITSSSGESCESKLKGCFPQELTPTHLERGAYHFKLSHHAEWVEGEKIILLTANDKKVVLLIASPTDQEILVNGVSHSVSAWNGPISSQKLPVVWFSGHYHDEFGNDKIYQHAQLSILEIPSENKEINLQGNFMIVAGIKI